MSLIGTAKNLGGGAFARTEESKHMPIKECILTQQFTGDVSYFKLPDGLTANHDNTKKKTKRNVPTRQLVHKPRTRETSETEQLLLDYLHIEFGDSVTVRHNGLYGGQDSYAARGRREFCLCCEDSHDSNGAFLTHLATLTGRLSGFTNYQDSINKDRQIIEYESLHRLSWIKYDMIIMDEIRSTLSSAVCSEANNGHMQENMEKLQHLTYEADRVICADSDLHIDGAVRCFCDTVFKNEEIHHIDHKGGGQELHVNFADSAAFVKMILKDLRAGKKIGVCCGSALELKTIEKLALDIVDEEEVGVYISPSQRGRGPRDMNQMKSRFRTITSGIVVVKVPNPMTAALEPLNADMAALHMEEMNRIMNRRTYITGVMTENQRELNRTIFKQGVGHEARFYPTLLMELFSWSHVERFLAVFHWIQHLIQIFEAKGYTWSTSIDRVGSEKEEDKLEKYFGSKGADVKEEGTERLEKADVREMDDGW
eukprot:g9005.t1